LSPSRAGDYRTCPRLYRFRVVEGLPEQPDESAARGTLVHAVLERLFDVAATERSLQRALDLVGPAWADMCAVDPELQQLGSPDGWLCSTDQALRGYFALEDPTRYQPVGRELRLEAEIDGRLAIRGIIDRLDEAPDGRLRVVDYKTGRCPPPGRETAAMFQLKFYALLVWVVFGKVPSVLRLMYLGDGVILEHVPDERELIALRRLLLALREAVDRAHDDDDWPASPGGRCRWCSFVARCPSGSAYLRRQDLHIPSG
jgi:putative RecB family exonuclease